ncbi:NADPH:quinone reductase [Actinomycetospora sp. NBRC 106375]|uniref:NADP-dependent oxidoreductase n=1 Tax=Actinomycetospora sp. NBRC 106375 TaxID=3032207 RepID=UPI0024A2A579|nr:NADP-dependent oxidoreductase [Actinomycetospora sp. NBRC 106375]GLZ43996.1 NADPH:quinone reductase [Actinomycetospora sp. NBRC 106375]
MTDTARAVRFDAYGDVDVLEVREVEVPPPSRGEVQVRVRAAGINPGESIIRSGGYHSRLPGTFPSGEGSDLAGVVSAVGEDAGDWRVGDEVLGWTDRRGSHAELVTVPADHLVRKPAAVPFEVAGALYVAGAAAVGAVRAVDPQPGETVLVSGAAGGVGSIAAQLARRAGARVIGVASAPNHAWLRGLGIEPVAYGDDLRDAIERLAPDGVDAVVDAFGGGYVALARELGVPGPRIDTLIDFAEVGVGGVQGEGAGSASSAETVAFLADLVARGELRVEIAATYPLEQVREAFTRVERRHTRGKIVLVP